MSYDKVKQAKERKIGLKQTLKAIELNEAAEVIVARDADPKLIQKVLQQCEAKQILVSYVDSMNKLGRICGIEVGAATVALRKE
ncbi:50S ribosomal protein L7ae-like protein [Bacillus horti]|uniref:Large subunit ribosomal protein L7A n=1 Tax=Caldalkalibacillus horti TaxID=77523 RepID=A0ABT9VYI3_9BACI|nr:50S ribosomal protein L7ae-like protein [Bacillus horti]MDQ0166058.1 large subunit ribosomal protein L7A [Bacillus horti]